MADRQVSYTLGTKLNSIQLDVVAMRVYVTTDVVNKTTGEYVTSIRDDVTDVMSPEQVAAALLLADAAKAYAEAKTP